MRYVVCTKDEVTAMDGTVVTWIEKRKFGFIRPDDSPTDVFVHIIDCPKQQPLTRNSRVRFSIRKYGDKIKAVQIEVMP